MNVRHSLYVLILALARLSNMAAYQILHRGALLRASPLSPRGNHNPSSVLHSARFPIGELRNSYLARKSEIERLKEKISAVGQSGLIAYGILNLSYYTIATSLAWYFTANNFVGERLLIRAAKTSSMVWVGSQATKIFRLSGAVLLAPLADTLLEHFQTKCKIKSRNKTFWILTGLILSTCVIFYVALLVGTSVLTSARF